MAGGPCSERYWPWPLGHHGVGAAQAVVGARACPQQWRCRTSLATPSTTTSSLHRAEDNFSSSPSRRIKPLKPDPRHTHLHYIPWPHSALTLHHAAKGRRATPGQSRARLCTSTLKKKLAHQQIAFNVSRCGCIPHFYFAFETLT